MRRSTIIVIIFILAAAVIVGASQFLRSQPPVEFTVAVSPLAANWVREVVNSFNASEPLVNATQRIQFNVEVIDDLPVWQGSQAWTPEQHPAAWIPASSASVGFFERYAALEPSLARTPLVWGGYSSRVSVVTNNGAVPLDWQAVQAAAEAESWSALPGGQANWGFVQLAFGRADQTFSGLSALFSAAATYTGNTNIAGNAIRANEFREWMTPIINSVNFQTLGADPAAVMARGPSTVQIALLPESLWLTNVSGLTANEAVVFNYPAYQQVLDFPFAGWADATQITPAEREAVIALGEWLVTAAQQARTVDFGLRPAQSEPDTSAALFNQALQYGIQLQPAYGQGIQTPTRTETQGLVQWFTNTARR